MKATKIKMRQGCKNSQELTEIDSIWIEGCQAPGYYKKEALHDYLKQHPGSIEVNIYTYPDLIPATSYLGEKYVRSSPNNRRQDNLLDLPRE